MHFLFHAQAAREVFSVLFAAAAAKGALHTPPHSSSEKFVHPKNPSSFRGRRVQAVYVVIDALCITTSAILAFLLRFPPASLHELLRPSALIGMDHRYGAFLLLDIALILLFCRTERLYRTPLELPFLAESFSIAKATAYATLLLISFVDLSAAHAISRAVILISAVFNIVAFVAWRYAKRRHIIRRIERGAGARNALVIGAGTIGQALATAFDNQKLLGYRFVGFLDSNRSLDARTLGMVSDLDRVARTHFVDDVFITIPSARDLVKEITLCARRFHFSVNVIPDLYDGLAWNAPLRHVGRFPVMEIHSMPIPVAGLAAKRVIDLCLAAIGLTLTAPLIAAVAVLIRRDSLGPAFYCSPRVGRKGQIFNCYKLRTMVNNANQLKPSLRSRNELDGALIKIADDPRITRIGRVLRAYSLDELPQFWNVLKGEMSLVGPRPHPVDDFDLYQLDDLRRLDVKPGMTGLWQVAGRRDPSFHTSMRLDLEYIENWNLRLDLRLIWRTFASVLRAEGC
jgi:exopolysaccharide biosynthesis polyprenyl glycosylphosphotransferase